MLSPSPVIDPPVERARPLLGTTVRMRVRGLAPALAHCAIDDAFAVVGHVHARMSFHEGASDVSRLNRDAHRVAVDVDPHTFEVLKLALAMSADTSGIFDVTVVPHLVDRDFLPIPMHGAAPDPRASWHDIELLPGWWVRFRRPLWIDLGGIAKGYAVDRAMERLVVHGALQASVNAGGDLRVHGPLAEQVLLTPDSFRDGVPVIELENGSIASSTSRTDVRPHDRGTYDDTFVSVVADDCAIADALTKAVSALGPAAAPVLARHGAAAHLCTPRFGWQHLGGVP